MGHEVLEASRKVQKALDFGARMEISEATCCCTAAIILVTFCIFDYFKNFLDAAVSGRTSGRHTQLCPYESPWANADAWKKEGAINNARRPIHPSVILSVFQLFSVPPYFGQLHGTFAQQ